MLRNCSLVLASVQTFNRIKQPLSSLPVRSQLEQVMSHNAYVDDKGAMQGGGHAGAMQTAQAPRLRSTAGSYAAWKPDMEVYLERIGAEGVHKRAMTDEQWRKMTLQVQSWNDEALALALAAIGAGDAQSSSSSSSSTGGSDSQQQMAQSLAPELKEMRKLVSVLVERSRRVFGVIWASLPEELRAQAAHVPQGSAPALWLWLQQKFQNTEQDSVGELLAQWVALLQEEDETFDAYRARVNQLKALLEHAKEPVSARMYAFMLLDKLQPRYKQAVLALKAGGQLKDFDRVSWDTITSFINQHERSELRMAAGGAEAGAIAAAARDHGGDGFSNKQSRGGGKGNRGGWQKRGGAGGQRGRSAGDRHVLTDPRTCFRCDEQGHIAENCPNPPKAARGSGGMKYAAAAAAARTSAPGGAEPDRRASEQASAARHLEGNRYGTLSSDEDETETQRSCIAVTMVKSVSFLEAEARGRAQLVAKASAKEGQGRSPLKSSPHEDATTSKHVKPRTKGRSSTVAAASDSGSCSSTTAAASVAADDTRSMTKLDAALSKDAWGWDTMASSGCSGNRDQFVDLRKCPAVPVTGMDGNVVNATHIGSVALRAHTTTGKVVRLIVHNVLYDKRFACNLLSSGKMVEKYGWQYHSTPGSTYVVTPGGHRIDLSSRGNVSVLMGVESERAFRSLVCSGAGRAQDDGVEQLLRLHQRLCHMGWTRMMNLLHGGRVEDHGVDVSSLSESTKRQAEQRVRECESCVLGRATRTAFGHRGVDRGTKPGECLHMDTYLVRVDRDGRSIPEYGLLIKDMFREQVWHNRLATKDAVATAAISRIREAETQSGSVVKRIYSDGGTEFINQTLHKFCDQNGKQLHWTPARTQQLNGGSERGIRTIKESTTMMMQHAKAPKRFWGRAADHAAFVWNRTHISKQTRMTPYESLRGKKPSLKHLAGTWGCDAYCHIPKEHRSALEAKAEPCIYLGHSEAQNAANVLLLGSKKVICSRDVTYRHGSFEFMRAFSEGNPVGNVGADTFTDSEDEAEADRMPAQGGQNNSAAVPSPSGASAAPDHEEDPELKSEEWIVDSIVAERKRRGRVEYKVHWSGFGSDEDSWEPEAEVRDLEALETWQAQRPAAPQVRRSTRYGGHASDESDRALRYDEEEDDDPPQIHMAMSALRNLQLPDEQPEVATLMSAVAAGIAALEQRTPETYRQAMASPDAEKWKEAMGKEYQSCMDQGTWSLVKRADLPRGANVLPVKTVFKIKLDEHGGISQYKARFTPKGFRQKYGKDYFETFARTGQYKSFRTHLSLVAKWDHEVVQMDVPVAFLNADLEEDVYMELPQGFEQDGMVCKLHKSLYGLKQGPRNWDKLIHPFIVHEMGFAATISDPSLYFRRSRTGRLMMIYRFVDDLQGSHHSADAAEFMTLMALLQKRFNVKTMATSTWMLGMRITRDRKLRTITLDQELYITKALERYGLQHCRVVNTPEAVGAAVEVSAALEEPADTQRYMEMTGTLMYAAISTRPDIAHAVHYLASHMQSPTRRHMLAAERVLRYLACRDEGSWPCLWLPQR
jgi:transposase InsO family protein